MRIFDLFKKKESEFVTTPDEVKALLLADQVQVPNEYSDYTDKKTMTRLEFRMMEDNIDRLKRLAESETREDLHSNWNNLSLQEKMAFISAEEFSFQKIWIFDDVSRLGQALKIRPYKDEYFYQACLSQGTKCLRFLLENNYASLEADERSRVLHVAIEKDDVELLEWFFQRGDDVEKFRSMELKSKCREFADRYFAAKDFAQNLDATLTKKAETTTRSGKQKI
ncbi:ankyrin repeat domain-containing protein [Burkholderia stagnalis]|uniref:Ankyrin repeat domain-containing protein n=1 Tax=Burkholderia stagnalis TaxID=1503054 RepID=A0A6L3N348_9BURK|nr:ankyrin repeat domain-containing protein [Burkholderia stagnalis]KAB0640703.1 ankyrin repeat domain-containing protein [Burkholderia stagnalis]VWB06776.1 hypothetical protein BST28156_00141 [Burkholderia stagnalis]